MESFKTVINYDSVKEYNRYLNTLGSGTPGAYVRLFLKYLANSRAEPLFLGWIDVISYTSKKKRRNFVPSGVGEKADIDLKMINQDLKAYYDLITQTDKHGQTKRSAYRNIVNILFGITTGMRPHEMDRLTWKMIEESKREIRYPDGHIKGEGYFILPDSVSKTHVERVIPIHPKIKPYLSLLKEVYADSADQPFDVKNFARPKENAGAVLKLAQMRNFAVKYLPEEEIGLPEFYRIAIMGHDEAAIKKALQGETQQTGLDPTKLKQKFTYGSYSDQGVYEMYMQTAGKNFDPIPKFMAIEEIRESLAGYLKGKN